MAVPQISLTEFPLWEFCHWHSLLRAYTYAYYCFSNTVEVCEETDQCNAIPPANALRKKSEFPLWELELEAKSNQDFNIFLKSDQTRYRSHRIRSRPDNSHSGNLINHVIGLIHQYYSNFKNDTKYENKGKQGLAVER